MKRLLCLALAAALCLSPGGFAQAAEDAPEEPAVEEAVPAEEPGPEEAAEEDPGPEDAAEASADEEEPPAEEPAPSSEEEPAEEAALPEDEPTEEPEPLTEEDPSQEPSQEPAPERDGDAWASVPITARRVSFPYESNLSKQTERYFFDYDESCFLGDSTAYRHGLVKMSLSLALSAGFTEPDNIRALYDELGFVYTESSVHYPAPSREADTIGYAIGAKNLTDGDGRSFTLVAVAIRGAGYAVEWAHNFRVGTGTDHAGFASAAAQVTDGLRAFLTENAAHFAGPVKVWIAGYSRGAATANLVAARLDNGAIDGLGTDNVYAFCFECPQNTRSADRQNSRYANITNIINPADFVTKVVMSSIGWGYGRYGRSYDLPTSVTTASYAALKERMTGAYEELNAAIDPAHDTEERVPVSQALKEPAGETVLLELFFDTLAYRFTDPVEYQSHQEYMMDAGERFGVSADLGIIDELLTALDGIDQAARFSPLRHTTPRRTIPTLPDVGIYIFVLGNGTAAHYPELCLSWLNTLSGEADFPPYAYRRVVVNGPADVTVYAGGAAVGRIAGERPSAVETGVYTYIDANGQKVCVLPTDAAYTVELTAAGAGELSYAVLDYDGEIGRVTAVTAYPGLQAAEGDVFTGAVGAPGSEYTLSIDGEPLDPGAVLRNGEVPILTVTAAAGSGGDAGGGGYYAPGEYALVTAEPDEGQVFLGWYAGETLVSREATFRFPVTESAALTAVFREKSRSVEAAAILWAVVGLSDDPSGYTAADAAALLRDAG